MPDDSNKVIGVVGPVGLALTIALTALSLIFFCCTDTLGAVGIGIIAGEFLFIGLLVGLAVAGEGGGGGWWKVFRGVVTTPLAVVAGGCVALIFLSLVGLGVRLLAPAQHYYFEGTRTTAAVSGCDYDGEFRRKRRRGGTSAPELVCATSTWTVGGKEHSGSIVVQDVPRGSNPTVTAFVIGDKGYSLGKVGDPSDVGRYGAVPWQAGLWALGVGVVALILLVVTAGRLERD